MILTLEDLEQILEAVCGVNSYPLLLVKDATSETGWRPWTSEDTHALCRLIAAKTAEVGENSTVSDKLACYNQDQAAAILNVSVPKFKEWLRDPDHPIPYMRKGRVIRIAAFKLRVWIDEECTRSDLPPKVIPRSMRGSGPGSA